MKIYLAPLSLVLLFSLLSGTESQCQVKPPSRSNNKSIDIKRSVYHMTVGGMAFFCSDKDNRTGGSQSLDIAIIVELLDSSVYTFDSLWIVVPRDGFYDRQDIISKSLKK